MGCRLGRIVGLTVGARDKEGFVVGVLEGITLGDLEIIGILVGRSDGVNVRIKDSDGSLVGLCDGDIVGFSLGVIVGLNDKLGALVVGITVGLHENVGVVVGKTPTTARKISTSVRSTIILRTVIIPY